jgi:hypothetical protein
MSALTYAFSSAIQTMPSRQKMIPKVGALVPEGKATLKSKA